MRLKSPMTGLFAGLSPRLCASSATLRPFLSFFPIRCRAVVAVLIAGMASTACYSYVPVTLGAVGSNEDVRVRVTEEAAARLVKELGTFSTEIDGQFAREGGDSISVGVAID